MGFFHDGGDGNGPDSSCVLALEPPFQPSIPQFAQPFFHLFLLGDRHAVEAHLHAAAEGIFPFILDEHLPDPAVHALMQPSDDIRMAGGKVFCFSRIALQIVQLEAGISVGVLFERLDQLPLVGADGALQLPVGFARDDKGVDLLHFFPDQGHQ